VNLFNDQTLPKPVCLIRGATEGVGKATAAELVSKGFTVVLAARKAAKAASVFESIALHGDVVTTYLAHNNARLLFGTDTPSDAIYTNPPGLDGRLEMSNWVAAGISLEKLFHALTIDNARILRLDDQVGTVEAGKIANLLLLRANPLESIGAYDAIETVFLRGRPIPRSDLSARNARALNLNCSLQFANRSHGVPEHRSMCRKVAC